MIILSEHRRLMLPGDRNTGGILFAGVLHQKSDDHNHSRLHSQKTPNWRYDRKKIIEFDFHCRCYSFEGTFFDEIIPLLCNNIPFSLFRVNCCNTNQLGSLSLSINHDSGHIALCHRDPTIINVDIPIRHDHTAFEVHLLSSSFFACREWKDRFSDFRPR